MSLRSISFLVLILVSVAPFQNTLTAEIEELKRAAESRKAKALAAAAEAEAEQRKFGAIGSGEGDAPMEITQEAIVA
jgi:hypothetical protein